MDVSPRYYDFSAYLSEHFSFKVQKISLNAGFTCPNRDGTVGYGGCTYCNNQTFNPAYCHTDKSVTEQLEEGKHFFARKYSDMRFLAYFQAYTNTYGELQELKRKYEEALTVPDVVGIVIGTRPDCMPEELLDYLEELNIIYGFMTPPELGSSEGYNLSEIDSDLIKFNSCISS